jgi:hypothetical protein
MPKNRLKSWLKSRKFKFLVISIALTLLLDFTFIYYGDIHLTDNSGNMSELHLVSNEPTYFYIQMNTTGPSYFFPVGEVHVSFSNNYANAIKNFTVKMSLDNSTWIDVPFSAIPQTADIGQTQLSGLYTRVYVVVYFPPQLVYGTVPVNIVENSFHLSVSVDAPYTPQTWLLLVLMSIALFSFTIQIIDFFFKEPQKTFR